MKKVVGLIAAVVVVFVLGFVAGMPGVVLGQSPDITRLVPFIRMGGGVPTLFDAQSTGKGVIAAFDLGVNPGQLSIVFGYGLQYRDTVSGQWTISDDGTISGGGCALAVLEPGWYPSFVILDGRYEIYDLPGIQQNDWQRKLVAERVAEQATHYSCSGKTLADVLIWNEDGTITSFATAVLAATRPATVSQAATTVVETAATAVSASADRRPSGSDQSIAFAAGESVYGWRIQLDNGNVCDGGECFLTAAPTNGTVTSGVVNPWPDEVSSAARANPWNGTANRN